jgi:hypothetical protein
MCGMVRTCRPLIDRQISAVLAEKLMEGLPEKYHDPDYDPYDDPDLDRPPAFKTAPSPNGANDEGQDEAAPPAKDEAAAAPSANGGNGKARQGADVPPAPRRPTANGDNGCHRATNGHAAKGRTAAKNGSTAGKRPPGHGRRR